MFGESSPAVLPPALGPQRGEDLGLMDEGTPGYPEGWVTSAAKRLEVVHPGKGTRETLLCPCSTSEGTLSCRENFYRLMVTIECARVLN